MPKKRDYKKEYREYHAKPEQKENRAKRNAARAKMEDAGRVRKGDGKDVDHKRPLSHGGSNGKSNLRVVSKSSNRAAGASIRYSRKK
jgi:hypothetical protein